jgi:plastocyanin
MRRSITPAVTILLSACAAWAVCVAACTNDDSAAHPPGPNTAGAPGDAAANDAGGDAGLCAPDAGATVQAKFDFASTAPTDGGKGQILSVHVCDKVVWINDDDGVPHGVGSTGGGFSFQTDVVTGTAAGAPLKPVQFPMAGTFTYDCTVHGKMMIGEITVQ